MHFVSAYSGGEVANVRIHKGQTKERRVGDIETIGGQNPAESWKALIGPFTSFHDGSLPACRGRTVHPLGSIAQNSPRMENEKPKFMILAGLVAWHQSPGLQRWLGPQPIFAHLLPFLRPHGETQRRGDALRNTEAECF